MKTLRFLFLLLFVSTIPFYTNNNFAQQQYTTAQKPTQYRRGIELQEGYQSYEEKYYGKNLIEEKRRLFPLQSTGVWTELNPKIPRVDYLGINFVNPDTGWAVGDLGALIKTTDGGQSWTVSETNTTTPILKVRSYNGQLVIASGFGGLILRSTDGGETFMQVTSGVTGDLWGLQMINDTLGWACGSSNSLVKTTDGGLTWQIVTTPGYTSAYWWIDFLNENYGFIAANGKVLRTTDGGNSWEIIQAGDNQALFCVDAIDSLHIAAAGYGGTGYRGKNIYSSDGGFTWITGGPTTFDPINCIKYINADTGYIVMSEVTARKTTDRGQSWTIIGQVNDNITDNYELLFTAQNTTGYSAGTSLKLNKAESNLDIWKRLIINDNFSDVFFVNEQKGFVISSALNSSYNALYKTIDGGNNWDVVQGAPSGSELFFIDSLTGFIGNYTIFKTIDGGENWYQTNAPNTFGEVSKVFFINEQTGWYVTEGGVIFKTTDVGENWFEQFYDLVGDFNSIYFIDSLYGWVSNISEWLYKTTNSGENWIQQTNSSIFSTTDIYFIDSLNGFAIKPPFRLYKTTDSGNNWIVQLNSSYFIRTFGWLSTSHGFIMGDVVYETIDSGNTWNEILELRNRGLRKYQAPKNYVGYSSGYSGLIYKYLDTTIVPVELTSFNAEVYNNDVILKWSTATETNNQGFKVLRSSNKQRWEAIAFIDGNGTTTSTQNYKYKDVITVPGKYFYQLKQIDYDGSTNLSEIIEVKVVQPFTFKLYQNYPNPFNPSTKIDFEIPFHSNVKIILYDITGSELEILIDKELEPGFYTITFNAKNYSSGIYFYRMTTDKGYEEVKKLTIIK